VLNVDAFVVGPGERVACVGDVVVNCRTADIAGTVFSRPATGVGQAGSSITINARQDLAVLGASSPAAPPTAVQRATVATAVRAAT